MPAWVHHMAPPGAVGYASTVIPTTGVGPMGTVLSKEQSGIKVESSSVPSQNLSSISQGGGEIVLRAMPDFTEVYGFLGSVFDPSANGHLERMREMAPIDRETVLLLMRNLSINLSSADFEEHRLFLSVYDMEPEDGLAGTDNDMKRLSDVAVVSQALDGGDDTLVSGHCELQVSERRELMSEPESEKLGIALQSHTDETKEHDRRCYAEKEFKSTTTGGSKAFVDDECLQFTQSPFFPKQAVEEPSTIIKFSGVHEDGDLEPPINPFEEVPLDATEGEAEIVDMWWS